MMTLFTKFLKDESGAQMAEYALLLVLIAILLVAAALYLKDAIDTAFRAVADCISNPPGGCPGQGAS